MSNLDTKQLFQAVLNAGSKPRKMPFNLALNEEERAMILMGMGTFITDDFAAAPFKPTGVVEVDEAVHKFRIHWRYGTKGSPGYDFIDDRIDMPMPDRFDSPGMYTHAVIHEVIHWTGGPKQGGRLNRENTGQDYPFEEVVADLATAMVLSDLGLYTQEQATITAQYIYGWLPLSDQHLRSLSSYAERKLSTSEMQEVWERACTKAEEAVHYFYAGKVEDK